MGRPREHNEATRAALLEAAERLVAERGASALSVRAVADAAGTTTRAVYSLFGSKEGLLVEALARDAFEFLQTENAKIEETDDPAADLLDIGRVFRRLVLEHPTLYRTVQEMLAEVSGMDAVSLQPAAGAHGELTGILLIRAYHRSRGDLDRQEVIVPDSSHGTNPATASMAGFRTVTVSELLASGAS